MTIEVANLLGRHMQRSILNNIDRCDLNPQSAERNLQTDERGYTLVALIAVMTLLALFAMAAAPNIRQQAQREREKEAIFRGEEVANAIRMYVEYRSSQEAAVDPLSSKGEWRLISPTSPDLVQFVQAVTVYAGGTPPTTRGSFQQFVPQLVNVINTGSTDTAPGGEDSSDNTIGPFLGVASHSQRNSVITYYGIDRHDQWIFTPLFR